MEKIYVFDLETDGLLDSVTKVHCMVAVDVSTRRSYRFGPNEIEQGLDFISQADLLVAHNGIGFDYPALRKLFPKITLPDIYDTLVVSRLIYADLRDIDFTMGARGDYALPKNMYGRHSLKAWGYRLGVLKGDFGETTDWLTYSPEMLDYCEQDCFCTLELLEKQLEKEYSKTAIDLEHEFATIIQRQVQNGFAFDEVAAAKLYGELCGKRQEIIQEMQDTFEGWTEDMKTPQYYISGRHQAVTKTALTNQIKQLYPAGNLRKEHLSNIEPGPLRTKHTPFNPGSRHHIYRVFREKYNWQPKEFTPKGEPKVDENVLSKLKYPEAQILSTYFLLDKRIGQLGEGNQAWLKVCDGGRIHGSVNTNGAVTGRCTHSHPNIAQVPSSDSPYGTECRSLFIAGPGKTLVGADASGLELRCLAHYMAHWDNGKYTKTVLEGDVHTENQEAAGLPTRANAKTFIYAFLYGAGDAKIGSIVGSGRKTGAALRGRFLKKLPALNTLVKTVKAAAKKGHIKGIDGRILKIRSEHAALNTLLQGAGAIVMKQSLVSADRLIQDAGLIPGHDYEFVANIHDEIQCEVEPEHAETVGKLLVQGIREAGDVFKFNCPLDGEYKIGESWAQTH